MKNQLSDIYEQILLSEAEKHNLQNPSSDEVGTIKADQELFDTTPKAVEGPEKAKLQQGPSYKETTGSATATAKASTPSFKGSAPAKDAKAEKGKEMKDTEVDPTEDKEEDKEEKKEKKEIKKESFTMSAFETLFKKTLNEELDETPAPAPAEEMAAEEPAMEETENESSEEELEEEEGDLISDLRELQDKLASILSKLEDVQSEEEELEGEEAYTEDEFDEEFGEEEGEEEEAFKESIDKPKPLNNSKGKALMSKKNKVGRLSAKGGKASSGSLKHEPKPKALGDKKAVLQKGKNEVKSSVKKGDFFK